MKDIVTGTAILLALVLAVGLVFVASRRHTDHFTAPKKELLLVHAEWCGHCKRLLEAGGVWDNVKKSLPGVQIREVDEADNAELVGKLNVTSFPDIRIVQGDETVAQFEDERTKDSIIEFVLKHIRPRKIESKE